MNSGDWRANMQISPWRPSWICKLADFRTQAGQSIRGYPGKNTKSVHVGRRTLICKLAHDNKSQPHSG